MAAFISATVLIDTKVHWPAIGDKSSLWPAPSIRQSGEWLLEGVARGPIYFRWRPVLPDPDDDLVLELAVACGAARIITHNRRHFT